MLIKNNKNILRVCFASSITLGCTAVYNMVAQSANIVEEFKPSTSDVVIRPPIEMLNNATTLDASEIETSKPPLVSLNTQIQVSDNVPNQRTFATGREVSFILPQDETAKVSFNSRVAEFKQPDLKAAGNEKIITASATVSTEPASPNQMAESELPAIKTGSDLSPAQRADREAEERIAALEKNIAELKRLIEMKSATAATAETAQNAQPEQLAGAENSQLAQAKVLSSNDAYRERWEIKLSDVRVDKALKRWATDAGYSFRWDADRYVMVGASSVYFGTIEEAIEGVLGTPGIRASQYPLEACIYKNSPPLIRITKMGDQAEECR